MDNTTPKKETKFQLDNVLLIDFFKAIDKDDPTIISPDMTKKDLEFLYIDFTYEFKDEEDDFIELIIEDIENEIYEIYLSLDIIRVFWGDDIKFNEISKYLKKLGYTVTKNNFEDDCEKIEISIKQKTNKIKSLKSSIVLNPNKDKNKKTNTYLLLASLSKQLKFEIDYDKLTIIKFIYYIKTLNKDE